MIFDNEQKPDRPLKKIKKDAKIQDVDIKNWINISGNLYLVKNPIVNGKDECEIEDLFSERTLNTLIGGKSFSRNSKSENDKYCGKAIFADYVMKNIAGPINEGFYHSIYLKIHVIRIQS